MKKVFKNGTYEIFEGDARRYGENRFALDKRAEIGFAENLGWYPTVEAAIWAMQDDQQRNHRRAA